MMTEMLRVLASLATSKDIDPIFKERANELISRILANMEMQIKMEEKILTQESAKMNGIMT